MKLKNETINFRASGFGLLIFLFSVSQVECSEQQVKSVQKSATKKQVVTTDRRLLAGFCLGASIGAVVAALVGLVIVSKRNSVINKLAPENQRLEAIPPDQRLAEIERLQKAIDGNTCMYWQYLVVNFGKLNNAEGVCLEVNRETGEITKVGIGPLVRGDIIFVKLPTPHFGISEIEFQVSEIKDNPTSMNKYKFGTRSPNSNDNRFRPFVAITQPN